MNHCFYSPLLFVYKVESIHRKGARLANVDQYGWSPLHHAARLGRKDVVLYIVENGNGIAHTIFTCIIHYENVIPSNNVFIILVPRDALDLQDEDKYVL